MLKKFWNFLKEHPIWSKVIAGVIVVILVGIYSRFAGWWQIIDEFIQQQVIPFIFAESKIPHWLFVVLSILAFFNIVYFVTIQFKRDWRSYKKDRIEGIVWRWEYLYGKMDRERLNAHCSKCDYALVVNTINVSTSGEHVILECKGCHKYRREFKPAFYGAHPLKEFTNTIHQEIEKRIRKKRRS